MSFMPNVFNVSVIRVSVIMPNGIYAECHLCRMSFVPNVICAECHLCRMSFMPNVFMVSVVRVSVVMLNVVAPSEELSIPLFAF